MNTYIDNTAFVRNLKSGSGNAGNSGKIDCGIVIGIGILVLIGGGILVYQNIQLRETVKTLNFKLREKQPVSDIND